LASLGQRLSASRSLGLMARVPDMEFNESEATITTG
jgi:hypothetical protein